jgi:hypothetical protein
MKRRRLAAVFPLVISLGLVSFTSREACAQSDEALADARAAAGEGATAFREQRYADAIDLFQRAESLVHAPPHLLYIARSYAALGKIVKAREVYRKVLRDHLEPKAPAAFERAQASATTELADMEARIPTVKITVQGADPQAIAATMDGAAVPAAVFGIARPVEPGEHKFRAIGEGLDSGEQALTVAERAHESLVLTLKPAPGVHLPTAAPAPGPAPEATPVPAPGAAPGTNPAADQAAPSHTNALRIGSYVGFGVGAVGLAIGTIFVLKSHSTKSDVQKICADGGCPEDRRSEVMDKVDSANGQGRLGVIGFVAGGLGAAAGVTLFVLSGSKPASSGSARAGQASGIAAFVGPSAMGLRGRF